MSHAWLGSAEEKQAMKNQVQAEFAKPEDHNSALYKEMHHGAGGAVEHVYGGAMSSAPQEGQMAKAWRPTPWGEWQLGTGVIHRVHNDDHTVTVQFIPDQGRYRLPFMSVQPILDEQPQYPTIRLKPGQRLPTSSEIVEREHRANVARGIQGIGNDEHLPGAAVDDELLDGEFRGADGAVAIRSQHWGIPGPTLEALRNRSIPSAQVTGEYGRHFYTDLYKNNFYKPKTNGVSGYDVAGEKARQQLPKGARVVSHTYIPHDGPALDLNMATGKWHLQHVEDNQHEQGYKMPESAWFLG